MQTYPLAHPHLDVLYLSIFDETSPEWVEVNVSKVRTERSRRFGDVWLALELMKKLGLPELFESVMPETHPKIYWATLAEVLVISRFCEPSSELHIAEQFYWNTKMISEASQRTTGRTFQYHP